MKTINILLTLSSLNVILVTIERFSFTTKIILQPYSFLRLHEVVQILTLILFTVLIPFFLLKELSNNFALLKSTKGLLLGLTFIVGVYLYATGNGVHELASYLFNTFCPTKTFKSAICQSMFFNDYYFGNTLYFVGAYLMNFPLFVLQKMHPTHDFTRKDIAVTAINSIIFSFAIVAYSGFDRVLVGLVFSLITMVTADLFLLTSKEKLVKIPFIFYSALAYTVGTLASLAVRFLK